MCSHSCAFSGRCNILSAAKVRDACGLAHIPPSLVPEINNIISFSTHSHNPAKRLKRRYFTPKRRIFHVEYQKRAEISARGVQKNKACSFAEGQQGQGASQFRRPCLVFYQQDSRAGIVSARMRTGICLSSGYNHVVILRRILRKNIFITQSAFPCNYARMRI